MAIIAISSGPGKTIILQVCTIKYDTWVLQGRRSLLAGDSHLLTYGAEYRDVSYAGTRVGTGKGSFTVTKGNITKAGSKATGDYYEFYVQDEWTVNDKLLLIPSLRYDGSKFGNEISPKISGTYKLNENSRLKASAARDTGHLLSVIYIWISSRHQSVA